MELLFQSFSSFESVTLAVVLVVEVELDELDVELVTLEPGICELVSDTTLVLVSICLTRLHSTVT